MSRVPDYKAEYVYFLYSPTQESMRSEIDKGLNKKFIPGQVNVQGEWKKFTQISTNPSSKMFADAVVVAEGYRDKMKFTDCTSQWDYGI